MVIGFSIKRIIHHIFHRPSTHIMELTWEKIRIACGPSGSLEATEALIKEHGADAVAVWRHWRGFTAIHGAVMYSRGGDVMRALITAGVDVTVAAASGWTALHYARRADEVLVLAAAGALVSARTTSGWIPLHEACANGHVEAARAMVEVSGGIPRVVLAKTNGGNTARDLASSRCHEGLLPVLDKAMREAEVSASYEMCVRPPHSLSPPQVWSRRSSTLLIGLAAADVVKAVAVQAGKKWAL